MSLPAGPEDLRIVHRFPSLALLCWAHSDEPRWRPFWAAWEVGAALQRGSTGVILLRVTGTGLVSLILGPYSGASLKEHPVQAGVSP